MGKVKVPFMISIPCVIEHDRNLCRREVLFDFLRLTNVFVVFDTTIFEHFQVVNVGIGVNVVSLSTVVSIEGGSE